LIFTCLVSLEGAYVRRKLFMESTEIQLESEMC